MALWSYLGIAGKSVYYNPTLFHESCGPKGVIASEDSFLKEQLTIIILLPRIHKIITCSGATI